MSPPAPACPCRVSSRFFLLNTFCITTETRACRPWNGLQEGSQLRPQRPTRHEETPKTHKKKHARCTLLRREIDGRVGRRVPGPACVAWQGTSRKGYRSRFIGYISGINSSVFGQACVCASERVRVCTVFNLLASLSKRTSAAAVTAAAASAVAQRRGRTPDRTGPGVERYLCTHN